MANDFSQVLQEQLVCDVTIGTDTASFDTNTILGGNINGGFTNIFIQFVGRSTTASGTWDYVKINFNGDTGSNYQTQFLEGQGSTPIASEDTSQTYTRPLLVPTANSPANAFSMTNIFIPFYSSTLYNKIVLADCAIYADTGSARFFNDRDNGLWKSTAAITRVVLAPLSGPNFKAGSRFMMYCS